MNSFYDQPSKTEHHLAHFKLTYISGSSIMTASVVPSAAKIEADQNNSPITAGRERIAPATDPKHS